MVHKFPFFLWKNNYKHINESIPPVPRPAMWIPLHLQKMVDAGLEKLEKEGTTEQVGWPNSVDLCIGGYFKKIVEIYVPGLT